ncbi:MAG: nucleotidyltransferase family protein [Candidatus Margulisiibacteriota bacterium]
MTKKKVFDLIIDNKNAIKGFGVKKLGIFGSQVSGTTHLKSDVDVLVQFENKTFDNYMGLKFFLESIFKTKVDLVTDSAIKPTLRPIILKQVRYVKGL